MENGTLLIVFLLIALFLIWFFVWEPQAREARAERKRLAEEERVRLEAKREKLKSERDDLLRSERLGAPGFIIRESLDFEREYRSKGGDGSYGQEMSPLTCFGYRVGKTNGRVKTERQAILRFAIIADLDTTLSFLPASYRKEWGSPLSTTRLNRIYNHLKVWLILEMVAETSKSQSLIGAMMQIGSKLTTKNLSIDFVWSKQLTRLFK